MRQEGLEEAQSSYKRNVALPKGIWRRGDKLAVTYQEHGAKRSKTFKDLNEALAFQSTLGQEEAESQEEVECHAEPGCQVEAVEG